jgi:Domain of unknown function (DUF4926)
MSLQLYDRVALRASFPEHALRAGDVATLVDFVDDPSSGPRGCVLELFNALGESIGVVTVPEDALEPLRADEVLSVRPMAWQGESSAAVLSTHLAEPRFQSFSVIVLRSYSSVTFKYR